MMLSPIVTASIRIDNLKGFQKLDKNHRIVTCDFLLSSRELAGMLNDSFGGRVAPMSNELISNCDKIEKVYRQNTIDFKYLDDMIASRFFTSILNDKAVDEDLQQHITDAYERTLKPHHNYFLREMSSMMFAFLPTRSKLLGEGTEYLENLNKIREYLPNICDNVRFVYDICNKYNVIVC